MIGILYKYPAYLESGDIIFDKINNVKEVVRGVSVYTSIQDREVYTRCTWVHLDSGIYKLPVLFKKYETNEIQQLVVLGNINE